jgi:hypothetical protein
MLTIDALQLSSSSKLACPHMHHGTTTTKTLSHSHWRTKTEVGSTINCIRHVHCKGQRLCMPCNYVRMMCLHVTRWILLAVKHQNCKGVENAGGLPPHAHVPQHSLHAQRAGTHISTHICVGDWPTPGGRPVSKLETTTVQQPHVNNTSRSQPLVALLAALFKRQQQELQQSSAAASTATPD